MGAVYTPEAVDKGYLPAPGAQEEAAHLAICRVMALNRIYPAAPIDAEIYGSLARYLAMKYRNIGVPPPNVRSDVDLLYRVEPSAAANVTVAKLSDSVAVLRSSRHVSIDFRRLSSAQIELGDAELVRDLTFVDHLLAAAELGRVAIDDPPSTSAEGGQVKRKQLVIGDPLRGLHGTLHYPEHERAARVAEGMVLYATHKEDLFSGALNPESEDAMYKALQRAFELPRKLGLKALALFRLKQGLGPVPELESHKVNYEEAYGSDVSLISLSSFLSNLDTRYTQLLEATIDDKKKIDNYERWLKSITRLSIEKALDLSSAAKQYASRYL